MPQEASKVADHEVTDEAAAEAIAESSKDAQADDDSSDSDNEAAPAQGSAQAASAVDGGEQATQKKKKNRKRKLKAALTKKTPDIADAEAPAGQHLSKDQVNMLLQSNPALKNRLAAEANDKPDKMAELIRNLNINDMLTGLAPQAKNVKDMGDHKFWKTQPVPTFDELASGKNKIVDGPIKEIKIEKVSKEPVPLPDIMAKRFFWVTMNLEDEKELQEVHDLLLKHYVEDHETMFRFRYSPTFLNW